MNTPRSLLLGAALLAAPAALAQQDGGMDHSQMDHGQMPGMDHSQTAGMDHDALMALHARMMADPEVHAAMQADPEMQALMAETMPAMDHSAMSGMDHSQMQGMDHGQMAGIDHSGMTHEMPMDADAQAAMMAQMGERMQTMPPADHAAFMARFEAAHRRLLATPAVHMQMMADPEARRLMEAMPGGMPGMGGMDHGTMEGMDHSQMDHSQMTGTTTAASSSMSGMDHGQMSGMDHAGMDHAGMSPAEHAAGVALQRRNAGVQTGDEREQSAAVNPAAFDASDAADRFHAALAAGDRAAMEAVLASDAVILEGGRTESRNEYLAGHFVRDAAALAGTAPEPLYRRTGVAGDAAWVASTQRVGTADRAELLVMKQTPDGWRVAAVHWSSAGN